MQARFFDGIQSRPQTVDVQVSGLTLVLTPVGMETAVIWRWADILVLDTHDPAHPARLSHRHHPDVRLLISDAEDWRSLEPYLSIAQHRGSRLAASWGTLAMYGILAALLVMLAVYYAPLTAQELARFVPPAAERDIGHQAMLYHFDQPVCVAEDGQAALRKIVARLNDALEKPILITPLVISSTDFNAFAFPGEYMVIFSGLGTNVTSVDELAGIIAHEMGHLYYKHPLRAVMRYLGFRFVLGMMTGNSGVSDAASFMSILSFSRKDEASADDFAIDLMQRSGLDVTRFADFFERLEASRRTKEPSVLDYVRTHPPNKDRVNAIRKAAKAPTSKSEPVLTAAEWTSYQNICGQTMPLKTWLQMRSTQSSKDMTP